jgi:hypothetical protein
MAQYRIPVLETFSWQPPVLDVLVTPDSTPDKGDRHIIGVGATGIWEDKDNWIATCTGVGPVTWTYDIPEDGWQVWNMATQEFLYVIGGVWESRDVVGPQGDQGPQGEAGPQGTQGDQGDQGFQGDQGPQGDQGNQGFQGAKGDQGDQGYQGLGFTWKGPWVAGVYAVNDVVEYFSSSFICIQATTDEEPTVDTAYWEVMAAKGADGETGDQGFQGDEGPQGEMGYQGDQGNQGFQGDAGAQGDQGNQGNQGAQGDQGDQGDAGADAEGFVWKGPWVSGIYAVNDCVEYNGSGYVCILATTDEEPTVDPTYWERFVEKGNQGDQGNQGNQGAQGDQGDQGAKGDQGDQGAKGDQGDQGAQGAQGAKGDQGDQGAQGAQGSFGGESFDYTFNTDNDDTDPGAGKLKFDNDNLSLATSMHIDDVDDNSTNIETFLHTIAGSTSTIKGHFKISLKTDASQFILFTIGGITDKSGYDTVACAYVSGSLTSFTNLADILITFARTGDVGDVGPQGDQGDQGAKGDQGDQGAKGDQGDQGAKGDQGDQGAKGDQGDQGDQGNQGNQGFQGETGPGAVYDADYKCLLIDG